MCLHCGDTRQNTPANVGLGGVAISVLRVISCNCWRARHNKLSTLKIITNNTHANTLDTIRACVGSIPPWVNPKNEFTLLCASDLMKLGKPDGGKLLNLGKRARDQCIETAASIQGVPTSVTDGLAHTVGLRLVHLIFIKKDKTRGGVR